MKTFEPSKMESRSFYRLLTSGVVPRPIALVSTLNNKGELNLAPFSFFNCFGMNPPCVVFSPVRRGRDGSMKDTCNNILATKECVVHIVTEKIVDQVNISAAEFDSKVNEFVKSGLTPIKSQIVKPFRVKESPVQMECRLIQHVPVGESNGSGNLLICEVLMVHVDESVLREDVIDPQLLKAVARCGEDYYARAYGDAIFELPRPILNAVGFENIPVSIKNSQVLSAKDLSTLARYETLHTIEEAKSYWGISNVGSKEIAFQLSDTEDSFLALQAMLKNQNRLSLKSLELLLKALVDKDTKLCWMLIKVLC